MNALTLLTQIVACASTPQKSASRNFQEVVTVPASCIEVARHLIRGPDAEGKRFLRLLLKRKFWGPETRGQGRGTNTRWRIVKRRVVGDDLHILGRSGDDYGVFSFWIPRIGPKMVPADKFFFGRKSGEASFEEICARAD